MIGFSRPWDRDLTFVLHTGSQAILPMPAPDPRPNITNAWWLTDPFTEAGGGRVRATATSAWSRPTARVTPIMALYAWLEINKRRFGHDAW